MNLYSYHNKPEELHNYFEAGEKIPDVFWDKFSKHPEKLKEKEHLIAKNPQYAWKYANQILKGAFPEGEEAIGTNAQYSIEYAELLEDRFAKGEDTIAKSAEHSYYYAAIIGASFPEGEGAIAKDALYSYLYARDVLRGRFREGEAIILNGSKYSYDYKNILKANNIPHEDLL